MKKSLSMVSGLLNLIPGLIVAPAILIGVYSNSLGPVTKAVTPASIQSFVAPLTLEHLHLVPKKQNSVQAPVQSKNAVTSKNNRLQQILNNDDKRAKFKYVLSKLAEYHLPKELAAIPIIESQYTTSAVSRVGAGGMWQLMPQTAKELGITTSQRFELAPSTVAALKYFRDLHNQFNNWDLAVAAYNGGSGRVQKALKQNPHATSVQQLKLPLETLNYVKQFDQLQGAIKSYTA